VNRLFGVLILAAAVATEAIGQSVQLTLTRDKRFGANDGSAAELTGFPRPVMGPDRDVYVHGACDIRHFDATGAFVGKIGRCGDGPGEFRSIAAVGFLGDTMWVSDQRHRRVTLFPPDRKNPQSFSASYSPRNDALHAAPPTAMLRGGAAIAQGVLAFGAAATSGDQAVFSPVVRLDRAGMVVDTMALLLARSAGDIMLTYGGSALATIRQPFNSRGYWAARPNGEGLVIVAARTVSTNPPTSWLATQIFNANGSLIATRRPPYTPVVIQARLRDSVARALVGSALPKDTAPPGAIADLLEQVRRQMVVPRHEPPITHLLMGNDGSIWIRREDRRAAGAEWLVLDAKGEEVGHVIVPVGLRLGYADLTQVLAVETDADDIPWVIRFRVSAPSRRR
jgi:hypothetical protein